MFEAIHKTNFGKRKNKKVAKGQRQKINTTETLLATNGVLV